MGGKEYLLRLVGQKWIFLSPGGTWYEEMKSRPAETILSTQRGESKTARGTTSEISG